MRNVSFVVVSACLGVLAAACGASIQEPPTEAQSQEPAQQQEGLATGTTCNGPVGTLFLDGDVSPVRDWVHPGADVITNGTWNVYVYSNTAHNYLRVDVTPTNSAQGLWWDVELSSQQLGTPLAVGTYTNAQRAAFATAGHPGLDVSGDGRGCNTVAGDFQIHDIVWDTAGLRKLNASFHQRCEAGTSVLRGMVSYERPAQ
jgi:hypothetical protein